MSLVRGGVTAVQGVSVPGGASLGNLRHGPMMAQNGTSVGVGHRRLSTQHGATLCGLAEGRLSAEDGTLRRPLSQRRLSAEDGTSLSSLREAATEDGAAAAESQLAHVKAVHLRFLLPRRRPILIGLGVLLEDVVVALVGEDVRSVSSKRAPAAGRGLRGIWGHRCGIWSRVADHWGAGTKVGQLRDGCAKVGGGRTAGVQVGRVRAVNCLRREHGGFVGALFRLGVEAHIRSVLGRSADIVLRGFRFTGGETNTDTSQKIRTWRKSSMLFASYLKIHQK